MNTKIEQKILKFLSAGTAFLVELAQGGRILLERGDDRRLAVDRAALAQMERQGLVARYEGRIELSSEGRSAVKRLEAGDNPFGEQHRELGAAIFGKGADRICATINLKESPLAGLARRRTRNGEAYLTEPEFMAGERFRADFTRGQIMPRMTANWEVAAARHRGAGSQEGLSLTDAALAARQRVDLALDQVGPELAGVLVDVCCFLKGLEIVEIERGWPVRSAKVILKLALAALARHL